MLALTTWILTAAMALTPVNGPPEPRRINVDCNSHRALQRAINWARWHPRVDIYLDGVCRGNYVIASDGVTLRAATPGSGVAAPDGDPGPLPVLTVDNASASVRGLIVRGGSIGVLVEGWDAEVLLYELDVHEQDEVGVVARRGADLRVLDTTVRDAFVGISADSSSTINLQRVNVRNQRSGVVVFDKSSAAINDSTIEDCSVVGLSVGNRSDVNVVGGVFRENGQVHINANDWSDITLLYEVAIGSETDSTPNALGANRQSTISSFTTSALYGDVSALVNGSIRLGNTVVHGDLTLIQFADALVRSSEITGSVTCIDGSNAICRQTTSGAFSGCPSPTCGEVQPGAGEGE